MTAAKEGCKDIFAHQPWLHDFVPPPPTGKPGQFARLQRDLGLPRSTNAMFRALSLRFMGKYAEETIRNWMENPQSRQAGLMKPKKITGRAKPSQRVIKSWQPGQKRYHLRMTPSRRAELLSFDPDIPAPLQIGHQRLDFTNLMIQNWEEEDATRRLG